MIAVVIAASRPRLPDLLACLATFDHPESGHMLVVVTTEPQPVLPADLPAGSHVVSTGSDEINLAKWYNLGLRYAAHLGADEILWLETDVRIPNPSILALRDALREHDLSMVGPDMYHRVPPGEVLIRREPRPFDIHERVCQASMVPASSPHRMDERMAWWYEADDLEWRCRIDRGTGLVGSAPATHPFSGTTPLAGDELRAALISSGRRLFFEKWGRYPH